MKGKQFRRAVLCMALGACLGSMAQGALAQNVTGAVAGKANAGDQVTVTNTGTGLSRTVTVGADGSYRLGQLPVGDYTLSVSRDGQAKGAPLNVLVSLGGATTVNLGGGDNDLDTVQVTGSRIVNRVDVRSTETATNVTREEWARLPVDQGLNAVALLAPGVVSNARLGGLSFGGSSMAENIYYINGMNVTDPWARQGFSTTPFGFFKEFQVKTGGYSAEFGRSTGGVINAVTRSGSNEFEGGVEFTLEPAAWSASANDHFYADGSLNNRASRDASSFYKTNVWASGPLVKDKLFFFAMYEDRDTSSRYSNRQGTTWTDNQSNNGFWGAKLDWNITDNHLLELLAFSDESETFSDNYDYDWASAQKENSRGEGLSGSGGDNWSITYTGRFTESFTGKLLYGVNNRSSLSGTPLDGACSIVGYDTSYAAIATALDYPLGCHPTGNRVSNREDEREMVRLDFEWALGDHLLRFGYDRELMTSNSLTYAPGNGLTYQAQTTTPGAVLLGGGVVPAGATALVVEQFSSSGGEFETEASAFYLEDAWSITPNLLLSLGVRVDSFDNKNSSGQSFIKLDNLVAPRLGFSWDMKGDGNSKLFGNLGRYYLPVTNNVNRYAGSTSPDIYTYYVLDGWSQQIHPTNGSTYLVPILGDLIGVNDQSAGSTDVRYSVDRDIKAVYQDEAILGYQHVLNVAWSWGVNATYRKMDRTLDDVNFRVPASLCASGFTSWPMVNPGEDATLWCDASQSWVTFDTSTSAFLKQGSNELVGYSKPKRTYKGVEFQIDRAWDGKWSFNASYLWSKSEGNFEGPVNSDTGASGTGLTQNFDHPANNERYGYLYNDHRHQFKFRGAYALNEQWSFGSTLQVQSGGPITAFGTAWPNDNRTAASTSESTGGGTGWICVANCTAPSTYDQRVFEYSPRAAFGRMPWTWTMGASATWTLPVEGIDLKARFSVYNLFNNQETVDVHSRYEISPGLYRSTFSQARLWQSPRYANLVVTWNF